MHNTDGRVGKTKQLSLNFKVETHYNASVEQGGRPTAAVAATEEIRPIFATVREQADVDTLGEFPTTEELEQLAERLLNEYSITSPSHPLANDLIIAIGTIYECRSLRSGIEHALETCTDPKTVDYLKELTEKTNQYYIIVDDAEEQEKED